MLQTEWPKLKKSTSPVLEASGPRSSLHWSWVSEEGSLPGSQMATFLLTRLVPSASLKNSLHSLLIRALILPDPGPTLNLMTSLQISSPSTATQESGLQHTADIHAAVKV